MPLRRGHPARGWSARRRLPPRLGATLARGLPWRRPLGALPARLAGALDASRRRPSTLGPAPLGRRLLWKLSRWLSRRL